MSAKSRLLPAALAIVLATIARPAGAESPDELFKRGAEALQRGEYGAAIDVFEAMADQGFVHPDAS